jgi:hypothetical protein
MKLASKGLGSVTLPFSLREADIKVEKNELWLHGAIKDKKVHWVYKMRLEDADIINFVALAKNDEIVSYLAQRCGFSLFFIVLKKIFKTIAYFLKISPDRKNALSNGLKKEL